MNAKLTDIANRYEEITHRLYDPATAADPAEYTRLMKERAALQPLADATAAYAAAETALAEAEEMMQESGGDKELHQLAAQEYAAQRDTLARLEEEIRLLLLPRDPNDDRSVIVEIRAGAGGEESALFAAALYRMYTMYAARRGFTVELVGASATELGGYREVSFLITGDGAYSRFKFESGVHRVQRVPETETGGRIHTSTATVAVLPEAEEVELEIDPGDLQIDTYRSSGAGGQHINKTESAIRVTHIPTNTVVECQDERSQYKNKDRALSILRSRLYERARQEQESALSAQRRSQVGSGMRNERIRTYNFPQGRVTDHRIGLTLYQIDAVMDGALDTIIDALAAADRAEQMSSQREET